MGDFAPRRFDFGLPAVVQQPFTHDGRDFKPGDEFPYEQLKLDKNAMRGFWLASLVDFRAKPQGTPQKRR